MIKFMEWYKEYLKENWPFVLGFFVGCLLANWLFSLIL